MPHRKPDTLLRYIRTVAAGDADAETSDRDLLRRFAGGNEAAFAALVRRHGPMVLRVCRGILNCGPDAEDAFQATFLILTRQAGRLRPRESVGGWLHVVAYRTAQKARITAARRAKHERRAPTPTAADPLTQLTVREAQDLLDRELVLLPDKFRGPLVLCYLEGLTREEAARRLGWPASLIKSRLEQGRDRLRARLSARGLSLPAALAAALVIDGASSAMSPALAAAALAASTAGSEMSASAHALAEGMMSAMSQRSFRIVAAVLVGLGLAGTGAGVLAHRATAEPPAAAVKPDTPPPQPPAAPRSMRVIVLDPDGKPLVGAKVHSGIWTHEKDFKANHDYQTDAAGVAPVELPKSFYILRLWASKKPFVEMFSHWEQEELASGATVPGEYTMRLERGVTAGGRVVDADGRSIAGARVEVSLDGDQKPANADGRTRYDNWLATGSDAVTTDADGRWRVNNLPDAPKLDVRLQVSHPEFVPKRGWRETVVAAGITTGNLRDQSARLTLNRGVIFTGRVTDPQGNPIKNALIVVGDQPFFASLPCQFPTDADGRYRLAALAAGQTNLTVIAHGWSPQLLKVNLQIGQAPMDFHMAPGKSARLRVVDSAGNPVPKADVTVLQCKGIDGTLQWELNYNLPKPPDPKIPHLTDANGVWEWTWAPDDTLKVRVSKAGSTQVELELAPGAADRTVVLKTKHDVTGQVVDAVTGKPIPAFTVIPVDVFRKDWLNAERHNGKAGRNGRLMFPEWRSDIPIRLRVEAMGYRSQDGPEFRLGDDAARLQNFRLEPSPPVVGTVLDPAGKPAAAAEVIMGTSTDPAALKPGGAPHAVTADAAGRFAFPDSGERFVLVARSAAGFAFVERAADTHDAGALQLREWATVRGQFRDGGKPIAGATVFLQPLRTREIDRPLVEHRMDAVTGPDGSFAFEHVPPGPASVQVFIGPWEDPAFRSGPHVPLDLQPGQRVELELGGGGAIVTGRVKLTGKVPADLDCTYSLNYLVRREPGIAPPAEVAAAGFDARRGWQNAWTMSEEGRAFLSTLQHWFVKLAPDGSFRVSGVPAGDYDLAVAVYAKPSGCLVDSLARNVVRVTVTADDVARGTLTVPEIAAEVVPIPQVGDATSLTFSRADGKSGSLADLRGKYALVHFWASWCGPCKQQLPAMRRLHEQFASRGLVTLGLSVDEDAANWQSAVNALDLPWPQGRVAATAAGVSGVPTYWLVAPDGKLLAKCYDADELAKAIAGVIK